MPLRGGALLTTCTPELQVPSEPTESHQFPHYLRNSKWVLSSVDPSREAVFPKVSILYERASLLGMQNRKLVRGKQSSSERDAGVSCSWLEVPQSLTSQPFLEFEPETRW